MDTLFDIEPQWCVDSNVISAFLKKTDDEPYASDVFEPQWTHIDRLFVSGRAVMAEATLRELEPVKDHHEDVRLWLRDRRKCVVPFGSTEQMALAKQIVTKYPGFSDSDNRANDLELITLAGSRGMTVVTMERRSSQPNTRSPKIPNACESFGIAWASVLDFLRASGFLSA